MTTNQGSSPALNVAILKGSESHGEYVVKAKILESKFKHLRIFSKSRHLFFSILRSLI